MKAQEFLIENSAIEMTPELENLVAKAGWDNDSQ